jgi:hypothetical protein
LSADGRRDLLVALSLANLCFVRIWGSLLNPGNDYFMGHPPSPMALLTAVAGMLLLGAAFFAAARLARRSIAARRIARVAFLATLLIAANAMRQQVPALSLAALSSSVGRGVLLLALGAAALTGAAAWWRWGAQPLTRAMATGVLALFPFAFLTLGQVAWRVLRASGDRPEFRDKPASTRLEAKPVMPRLLFLVFDALDEDILMSERPRDLELPEWDAILAGAVRWENAYPPSNNTGVSLPALITGRNVVRVRCAAADELMLSYAEEPAEARWSEAPTLFSRLRERGGNAALVGWYHPYCRILGDDLVHCRWYPYLPNPADTFRESVATQAALLVDTVPGTFRFGLLERVGAGWLRGTQDPRWHAEQYRRIHADAREAAADPRLSLVFVHYPIPHSPFIYDRTRGAIDADGQRDYVDNLALFDRSLGELRDTLEAAALWDRTALLITSDHWFRRPGWRSRGEMAPLVGNPQMRVPLMLRLPGVVAGVARPEYLRNHAAHALAEAVLDGRLRSLPDLDPVLHALPDWMRPLPGVRG